MRTILIIDDDENLRAVIGLMLEKENFRPVIAANGITGLRQALISEFALILLDLNMPGLNGTAVCGRIRAAGIKTPIIILSAIGDELDKALLLDMGADDYVVKPFSSRELVARIRAILRRSMPYGGNAVFSFSDIEVDIEARVVRKSGHPVSLTVAEFNVLTFLVRNPERPLSRELLLKSATGLAVPTRTRMVDSYINRLRQKLENDPEAPRHFLTVQRFGYRFVP